MVRSTTDKDKGTASPKPVRKSWVIGSIPADDKGFLEWRKDKSLMSYGCTVLEGMVHYVNQLNFESAERYELEMKEYKALLLSAANNDTGSDPDQAAEPAKLKALDDTSNTNMNIPTPQIISPLSQNISEPQLQEQSTTLIPEQSSQEQSTPLFPEHSSQNIPVLPLQSAVPATAPSTEQNVNANSLTMSQALELFELLQSRRASEVVRPPTIEAQHVEVAPGRAEPLSFMTLQTVERIIESTDFDAAQGQTSWESKMNKFVDLGHAYSSVNTVSGEMCYMVDGQLYKNILLAVAARKQNEHSLATAAEKLEQHMEQIESSNERVMQGEKDALEKMTKRMNKSLAEMRDEQHTRMQNVMVDIRALNDSMVASAEHSANSGEMQRLIVQVEQYDQIFPICQAQVKDLEQLNKKLRADLLEEKHRNERMRIRMDKAEALAIRLGAPKTNKRSRTDEQGHESDGSDHGSSSSDDEDEDDGEDEDEQEQSERSSSHSEDEQDGAKGQQGTDQVMETSKDSSTLHADPKGNNKDKEAAPGDRTTYREALKTPIEQHARDAIMTTSSGTEAVPAPTKLLTLSSSKKGDSDNKRTRSSAEQSSDKEQPSNKKAVHHTTSAGGVRNQEKEEAIQEEVRKSAQNVRWIKGPIPANLDQWFYDLRNSGTEPPASLVASSRKMVIKWKTALGGGYFPFSPSAGGSIMGLEHAYRTFKAVTMNMPLSGWTSRACAKHQIIHDRMSIPKLIARDGNPLNTRPCPLIYYYEQLLEDMRHIVTHHFETIPRTILNPIPKPTTSSPFRNSRTAPPNSSSSSTPDRYAWRQPKSARGKKSILSADEHFQELAKDTHERNKNISNPYEHEDTEQYNCAFDPLLSEEKKDQVARAKKLIRLIKSGDPPRNYVERRANKLREDPRGNNKGNSTNSVHGFCGTTIREYDEFAIFDLEQFIENISTDNADMHILGYYEDRIGAYPNINSRDGPSGQGSR